MARTEALGAKARWMRHLSSERGLRRVAEIINEAAAAAARRDID